VNGFVRTVSFVKGASRFSDMRSCTNSAHRRQISESSNVGSGN